MVGGVLDEWSLGEERASKPTLVENTREEGRRELETGSEGAEDE